MDIRFFSINMEKFTYFISLITASSLCSNILAGDIRSSDGLAQAIRTKNEKLAELGLSTINYLGDLIVVPQVETTYRDINSGNPSRMLFSLFNFAIINRTLNLNETMLLRTLQSSKISNFNANLNGASQKNLTFDTKPKIRVYPVIYSGARMGLHVRYTF